MTEKSKMDEPIMATCKQCEKQKVLSFRKLKNKWPHCPICKQPMKVNMSNAVSPIYTTD